MRGRPPGAGTRFLMGRDNVVVEICGLEKSFWLRCGDDIREANYGGSYQLGGSFCAQLLHLTVNFLRERIITF